MDSQTKDDRIASLMAVKCPGKTHSMIKSKTLRAEFAKELNDWRNQRNIVKKKNGSWYPDDYWVDMRWGLENGFLALQKSENRAFVYDEQNVSWQLVARQDYRTDEERQAYMQYEAEVIALHAKTLRILQRIDASL